MCFFTARIQKKSKLKTDTQKKIIIIKFKKKKSKGGSPQKPIKRNLIETKISNPFYAVLFCIARHCNSFFLCIFLGSLTWLKKTS